MRAGLLYIIESADQTNVNFIEGAGKKIDPYSEVVTINTGTAESPVYKWCFLGSVFTVKDKVSFGTAFPTAPFDGQAFLYVGEDKYTYSQVPSLFYRPSAARKSSLSGASDPSILLLSLQMRL